MTERRKHDSREATWQHIEVVRKILRRVIEDLMLRADLHDQSKLNSPEVEVFDEYAPKLKSSTYGSPEYKEFLEGMGEGLKHHYKHNDHHPEHFPEGEDHETEAHDETEYLPGGEITVCNAWCNNCDWTEKGDPADTRDAAAAHEREHHKPGGIHAMGLTQLTEMLCDWLAATSRHDDDKDIRDSIEINAERFGYGEEIKQLLLNTLPVIEEKS